jgi:hypothetical protein
VALWHGLISVGALFDYRGGYRVLNYAAVSAAFAGTLKEQNVPGESNWLQTRAAGMLLPYGGGYPDGFFEDGSFVRFRELSLTVAVPARFAHLMRVDNVSVTGAVRNLALWTRYTGGDPEVSAVGGNLVSTPSGFTTSVNNDFRANSESAVPLPRYWVLRVNLGL